MFAKQINSHHCCAAFKVCHIKNNNVDNSHTLFSDGWLTDWELPNPALTIQLLQLYLKASGVRAHKCHSQTRTHTKGRNSIVR